MSQKQGVSTLGLARLLGIKRQKTGWKLLTTIRGSMTQKGRAKLSGVVEIDETFVGGIHPGKRGRGALGKALVLVAVEDTEKPKIGRIRLRVIPDATSTVLLKSIQDMVQVGSTIRTDELKSYEMLVKHGYKHVTIKKDLSRNVDSTPLVHRIASLLKRWILGTHQGGIHLENLQSYLDEFVFRFNRRTSTSRGKLFYRLVQAMLGVKDS
jgi:transposase-like protein